MGLLSSLLSGFELGAEPDMPVPDLSPDENFILRTPLSPLGNPAFPQAPILDPAQFAGSLGSTSFTGFERGGAIEPAIGLGSPVTDDPTQVGSTSIETSPVIPSSQTSPSEPTQEDLDVARAKQIRQLLNILALLTAAGGVGGIVQNLMGGGGKTTIRPRLSPEQLSLLGETQGQFGQTGSLLQSLMGAITTPQIPPALSALVEQSFQPQLGNIATQAIESARRRGFSGGAELLNTGPGGAIAGPPLAALQGQMAAQKLNLYQNNIVNLLQAVEASRRLASSRGGLATSLPSGRQTINPTPSILQTIGEFAPILGSVAGVLESRDDKKKPTTPGSGLSQVPTPRD